MKIRRDMIGFRKDGLLCSKHAPPNVLWMIMNDIVLGLYYKFKKRERELLYSDQVQITFSVNCDTRQNIF